MCRYIQSKERYRFYQNIIFWTLQEKLFKHNLRANEWNHFIQQSQLIWKPSSTARIQPLVGKLYRQARVQSYSCRRIPHLDYIRFRFNNHPVGHPFPSLCLVPCSSSFRSPSVSSFGLLSNILLFILSNFFRYLFLITCRDQKVSVRKFCHLQSPSQIVMFMTKYPIDLRKKFNTAALSFVLATNSAGTYTYQLDMGKTNRHA